MKSKHNTKTSPVLNSTFKNLNRDTAQLIAIEPWEVRDAAWCIAKLKELVREEKARRALAATAECRAA